MANELAFVLINPRTIERAQTGAILSRLLCHTRLDLTASRMFGPSADLVAKTASVIRESFTDGSVSAADLADYVEREYAPTDAGVRRAILLLFEGEDAIAKIADVVGVASDASGATVRGTFGHEGEPAVIAASTAAEAKALLAPWGAAADTEGGILDVAAGVGREGVETTLMMVKPDSFRGPSLRPGSVLELMAQAELSIVGINLFHMTVSQALEFYAPVREVLRKGFGSNAVDIVRDALNSTLAGPVSEDAIAEAGKVLGPAYGDSRFENIVEFMAGYRPSDLADDDHDKSGTTCLAVIYRGVDAIAKVRALLGPTNPEDAGPGTVRFDFGSTITINGAHASDSVENAKSEIEIIGASDNFVTDLIARYS